MTKAKHTSGPWNVVIVKQGTVVSVSDSDGDDVANMPGNNNDGANARLIAAAPELLAACLAVVESCDLDDDWQPWAEQCRAAIYKATGSEQ